MKRHYIKRKEFEEVIQKLPTNIIKVILEDLTKKSNIERIIFEGLEIYTINEKPIVFKDKETVYPSLIYPQILDALPKILIDKGAVSRICNGADVMRPGVLEVNGCFSPQSLVVIVDSQYHKPLAIGVALYSNNDIIQLDTGKILKNIHYVGDKTWKIMNSIIKS